MKSKKSNKKTGSKMVEMTKQVKKSARAGAKKVTGKARKAAKKITR